MEKDRSIDEQIEVVYDELKYYIEGLTCCDTIHHNILIRESRFEYAMSNLKFLVWKKLHNKHNLNNNSHNLNNTSHNHPFI